MGICHGKISWEYVSWEYDSVVKILIEGGADPNKGLRILLECIPEMDMYVGAPEAKGSLSKRGQSLAKVKLKWRQSVDVSTLYLHFTISRT